MLLATFDSTIDTKQIDPEQDFAPVDDPSIPRTADEDRTSGRDTGREADEGRQPAIGDEDYNQSDDEIVETIEDLTSPEDEIAIENTEDETGEPSELDGQAEAEEPEFVPELLEATGLTEDQAREQFGNAESLAKAYNFLNRRYIEQGRSLNEQDNRARREAEDVIVEEEKFALPPRSDGEDWDPEVVALIESVNKRTESALSRRDSELQKQKEYLSNLAAEQRAAANRKYIDEFDSVINDLPDEFTRLLGSGSGLTMDPSSIQFQNRVFLDQSMQNLSRALQANGRPVPKMDSLMVSALAAVFPDVTVSVERQRAVAEIADQQKRMTSRPTQRRSNKMTGLERAFQSADDWYSKTGISGLDNEFDIGDL